MNILVAEDAAVNAILLESILESSDGNPAESPVLLRELQALRSELERRGVTPA